MPPWERYQQCLVATDPMELALIIEQFEQVASERAEPSSWVKAWGDDVINQPLRTAIDPRTPGKGRGTSAPHTKPHGRASLVRGRAPRSAFRGSGAGSRRGASYRCHSVDNTTTEEGRSPGSRRVWTREGSGEWREVGNSGQEPANPRGKGHHSQAGADRSLLPAVRHGSSSGPPGLGLCPGAAMRRSVGRGRGGVRGHRGSRAGARVGRCIVVLVIFTA
jgi:hypothetical protein